MKQDVFDVVVVGAGHAGVEAAHAAARMGAEVALVTMKQSDLGVMSCNPAFGGLGKGHLVREVDALDGVVGKAADASGIQFRLLNRRKGPAVQGPRLQSDRAAFQKASRELLAGQPRISLHFGEVIDLVVETGGRVSGIVLNDGGQLRSRTVILTTGTFLGGLIHVGQRTIAAGRVGDNASNRLSHRIRDLGLPMGRLKTGTPPRLESSSIDWSKVERQDGDSDPVMLSFMSSSPTLPQVSCGITHTNASTHEIIRENLGQSAMYGGRIDGVGPRYCPSIEDKVVRFAEKESHQIFLEPEGLSSPLVYPNGISTSLPEAVQDAYVRSIVGLENVVIAQYGYAIEYDYVDPRSLHQTLELRNLSGLFLAGQINGTTGYEEASAQGLVAGLNAASQALGRDDVTFNRSSSYIGVMIDDLTRLGVTEPYRMFTSRAEYRLTLRADNADARLTEFGRDIGCVSDDRFAHFVSKQARMDEMSRELQESVLGPDEASSYGVKLGAKRQKVTAKEMLGFPGADIHRFFQGRGYGLADWPPFHAIYASELYRGYEERQRRDAEAMTRDGDLTIPHGLNFRGLPGLSGELSEKLANVRPSTIVEARAIEGMTPSAVMLLVAHIKATAAVRSVS